ncbi:hypothetical protein JOC70_003365 [Clostridium pascui]|uniref:hypothetical protein n=1 Tax=Clostridium pascui TaxID=46609 RepID=UPI001FAE83A7|nr:hypothetical protein [Clostridium pascui]MBM7871853.1 hypothetical protein [Clostridium pascui]
MSKHRRHRRDRDRDADIERGRSRRRDRNDNIENVQKSNNINSTINNMSNMNGNNIMDMLNNIDQEQLNSIMQSLGANNPLMGNLENTEDTGSIPNTPPVQDKTLQLLYTLKPMLTPDKAILIDRIIQIYSLSKAMNG